MQDKDALLFTPCRGVNGKKNRSYFDSHYNRLRTPHYSLLAVRQNIAAVGCERLMGPCITGFTLYFFNTIYLYKSPFFRFNHYGECNLSVEQRNEAHITCQF